MKSWDAILWGLTVAGVVLVGLGLTSAGWRVPLLGLSVVVFVAAFVLGARRTRSEVDEWKRHIR